MYKSRDIKGGPGYLYATAQLENPPIAYTLEIAPEVFANYLTDGALYSVEIPHEGVDRQAIMAQAVKSTRGSRQRVAEEEKEGDEKVWDSD